MLGSGVWGFRVFRFRVNECRPWSFGGFALRDVWSFQALGVLCFGSRIR